MTGDPLWSLSHTRDGTELLDRETGLGAALELLPRHLDFLVGPFVLAAAAVGAVTAGRRAPWIVAPAALDRRSASSCSPPPGSPCRRATSSGIAAVAALLAGIALTGRWRWVAAALLAAAVVTEAGDLVDVRQRLDDDAPRLEALIREAPAAVRADRACRRCGRSRSWPTGRTGGRARSSRVPPGAARQPDLADGESESWIGGGGPGQPPRVRRRAAARLRARSQAMLHGASPRTAEKVSANRCRRPE